MSRCLYLYPKGILLRISSDDPPVYGYLLEHGAT